MAMLTKQNRQALNKILDELDRLFDGDSTLGDVHAVLAAAEEQLRDSQFAHAFEVPLQQLHNLNLTPGAEEQKREAGLVLTDDLRVFIATELRRDAQENPRQRHT
jgi:hypothetical protein